MRGHDLSVHDKRTVLKKVSEQYYCTLSTIKGKQIIYQGVANGQRIVLCTPKLSIHQ